MPGNLTDSARKVHIKLPDARMKRNRNMKKNNYISQLQDGQTVRDIFVITEARLSPAKNGPFWHLVLQDATGSLVARIWSPQSQAYESLQPEQVALVSGQTGTFRGSLQLNITELSVLDPDRDPIDWSSLIPCSDPPPEELIVELETLLQDELSHAPWRRLCRMVLTDPEVRPRLLAAPAAKSIHHAYRGGLLKHTLDMCRLLRGICDCYPDLDREILLTACLLHDLGKAWEIGTGASREYTDPGKLLGHIQLGLEVLEPFLHRVKSLDPELVLHLKHIIVSHHGELAFGSPRVPMTREAMALHFADNLDAKLETFSGLLAPLTEAGTPWTPYNPILERQVFQPRKTPGKESKNAPARRQQDQCSLPLKE